jgi:hypothetical protein
MRTEWVIHIWGKERDVLELTQQEKFHMDMIRQYDHSIFDRVLINIAMYDINDDSLFDLLKGELINLFSDVKEVDIRKCQNDRILCEYVTFRPYVWDRIGEDVRIFYSHFKGYVSNALIMREEYPKRNIFINEYYWSYLQYRMLLGKEYVDEMKKSFDSGKDVYCWCLFDKSNLQHIYIPKEGDFYTTFFRGIEENAPNIKDFYVSESMCLHSPGSFVWYDMKNIANHIGLEVIDIISLDDEIYKSVGSAPQFSELYIYRFLNIENIQVQTFINNVNQQFLDINNAVYTQIYCSKKICNEYIKDFDTYIIQNKII